MTAEFPDYVLSEEVTESGWWNVETGKETKAAGADRERRVAQALETRVQVDEDARIAIVSHAGFIDRLIRALLGHSFPAGDEYIYRYHTDNTSISHLKMSRDPEWPTRMFAMNRLDHL